MLMGVVDDDNPFRPSTDLHDCNPLADRWGGKRPFMAMPAGPSNINCNLYSVVLGDCRVKSNVACGLSAK